MIPYFYLVVRWGRPSHLLVFMWAQVGGHMQESCGDSVRPIFLRVLVSLSNQCLRLCCSPYNLFLGIHNWLVWLNGQPMGGLIMMVSLSGNVVFQKQFL